MKLSQFRTGAGCALDAREGLEGQRPKDRAPYPECSGAKPVPLHPGNCVVTGVVWVVVTGTVSTDSLCTFDSPVPGSAQRKLGTALKPGVSRGCPVQQALRLGPLWQAPHAPHHHSCTWRRLWCFGTQGNFSTCHPASSLDAPAPRLPRGFLSVYVSW